MLCCIIVSIIVCIGFVIYFILQNNINILTSILSVLLGILAGFVMLLTMSFVNLGAEYAKAEIIPINETKVELYALKDNFNCTSSFYLFNSVSKDTLKYSYIYKVEGKGLTTGQVDTKLSYINYINENEKPYIIIKQRDYKNKILRFFTWSTRFISEEYLIYIPEGSITTENQYSIDLE